jgi:RNA polymerase sigma factor (sigma-70 family)
MSENKQLFISIQGQLVPVTEEIYLTYYRARRRMRYYEHDIKTGKPIRNQEGVITGYKPPKEDSLDRLLETGMDFPDSVNVEETIINAMIVTKLHEVLGELTDSERELIDALFFSNDGDGMNERKYAKQIGVSQQSINERKQRILRKLKKLLEN